MADKNIGVKFSVTGTELASYIDNIKNKSDELTKSAIAGAITQSDKAKEQLKLIGEQITLLERKSKLETQNQRGGLIGENAAYLNELEMKRKRDLLFLGSKRGKDGYSEDW